jgi:hypothetical protein
MAEVRDKLQKSELHSSLQIFKHAFEQLSRNDKILSTQLRKAESEYPLVVLSLILTSAYARFTERFYLNRFLRTSTDRPIPGGNDENILTWPPELTAKDIFQQLEEWSNALIEAGAEYERDTRIEVRACPIIRQDYRSAETCVQRYLENPPQSDEEWSEYLNCLENLSLYASEMRSHNCSF